MANETTILSAADERQKQIDQKTSVGQYVFENVKDGGTALAGWLGGGLVGYGLRNQFNASKLGNVVSDAVKNSVFKENHNFVMDWFLPAVVGFAGAIVAGIVKSYGRWKKKESETIAVSEINQDIANLVGERGKFAETLTRQESFIKELVERGQKNPLEKMPETEVALR